MDPHFAAVVAAHAEIAEALCVWSTTGHRAVPAKVPPFDEWHYPYLVPLLDFPPYRDALNTAKTALINMLIRMRVHACAKCFVAMIMSPVRHHSYHYDLRETIKQIIAHQSLPRSDSLVRSGKQHRAYNHVRNAIATWSCPDPAGPGGIIADAIAHGGVWLCDTPECLGSKKSADHRRKTANWLHATWAQKIISPTVWAQKIISPTVWAQKIISPTPAANRARKRSIAGGLGGSTANAIARLVGDYAGLPEPTPSATAGYRHTPKRPEAGHRAAKRAKRDPKPPIPNQSADGIADDADTMHTE